MNIEIGDIWDKFGIVDAICITTNGFVKSNGAAVMGRGIASQAKEKFPGIDLKLGYFINSYGNIPGAIYKDVKTSIVSFPVKPMSRFIRNLNEVVSHQRLNFKIGDKVPGWALKADLELIEDAAYMLPILADSYNWDNIVLTKPGCKNGELSWDVVRPILENRLDSRFTIVDIE